MLPAGASNSWNGYHWAGQNGGDQGLPVNLTLVNHLSEAWPGVLAPVSVDWNRSSVVKHVIVDPGACELPAGPPAVADATIDVCNGAYGENGWLGLAQIWVDASGHILTGSVQVNDTYFSRAPYDDANARRHVLCQETGHTFGLDHQHSPKAASCMNDSWGLTSASFVSPNQHDYDQLAAVYCHLGPGPCGGTKGGGGKGKSQGKGQVFERTAPNGARFVTFILRP
jgi:hypothetical protein